MRTLAWSAKRFLRAKASPWISRVAVMLALVAVDHGKVLQQLIANSRLYNHLHKEAIASLEPYSLTRMALETEDILAAIVRHRTVGSN